MKMNNMFGLVLLPFAMISMILASCSGDAEKAYENYVEDELGLDIHMVYVEGGVFQMGATAEHDGLAESDEYPVHTVALDSYYISATEVTQAQWRLVMGTDVYQQKERSKTTFDTTYQVAGVGSDYPIYYVSFSEAQAFCRELSNITGRTYVLPTEAQWEYAARGGNQGRGGRYSGGHDAIDAVAWYKGNGEKGAHPVGQKRTNELGLYDMSGNVFEWCSDYYGSYSSEKQFDPTGAISGDQVVRGGSWNGEASSCRVSNRTATDRYGKCAVGFRIVRIID